MEHTVKKGQTSIEFMLLIVITLLYIQTVINPNVNEALSSVSDTTRVSQARLATEKLANAVNFVAASNSEAKTTINLFIPDRTIIYCDESKNRIRYETAVDQNIAKCGVLDNNPANCDKNFELNPLINLQCAVPPFNITIIPGAKVIDSNYVSNPVTLYVERDSLGTVTITGNIS
ncbi:hypothetical protein KKG83_00695 [Candidatus Micrarchaeota archaeon]|nr:hypothetical protein [Candidatus Micrarchaeota archaeon]MBU2475968.1 hypothetical protein [Candidatus Micrarchaeota archaeon]